MDEGDQLEGGVQRRCVGGCKAGPASLGDRERDAQDIEVAGRVYNCGHGQEHLCTVMMLLMLLVFLYDQCKPLVAGRYEQCVLVRVRTR